MPSKKLSSIIGGGVFRTETFVFNQTISSGQTGDLVTIGTAGKVTRVTLLIAAAAQTGISIDVDGSIIVGPDTLADDSSLVGSDFFVALSAGGGSSFADAHAGSISDVFGEFITFKKDSGNTTQVIRYSYETGSIS